jgi:6-phosphofructokinase 1
MSDKRRVGILTGGGDAPGLNAVIRAFVKRAVGQLGWEVVGIEDAFDGLLSEPRRVRPMTMRSCQGLLHRGGTILGTTNRGHPFRYPGDPSGTERRGDDIAKAVKEEGLEALVCIGGDGTQVIAMKLMTDWGINVVGIPKTIDNDLSYTDYTFGFQTAVNTATDAIDKLHTTAESHDRVMFLEVMGRDAGHIALHAGIGGGADVILIPEIPYEPSRIAAKVKKRQSIGRHFTIAIVAEGALPAGAKHDDRLGRKTTLKEGGGAANIAMTSLEGMVDVEMRTCVLGHLQRGGGPVPFDRILATRYGAAAVDLVEQGKWGEMVCMRGFAIESVKIADAVATYRLVDVEGQLVQMARQVGIELGA